MSSDAYAAADGTDSDSDSISSSSDEGVPDQLRSAQKSHLNSQQLQKSANLQKVKVETNKSQEPLIDNPSELKDDTSESEHKKPLTQQPPVPPVNLGSMNENETVQLQDLIFLTDFFPIPDLIHMVTEATIAPEEIEFQMLNQIQVQKSNEDVLEHRLLELPIKAFEFKYSPVTLSFILVILKIVGLI